MSSNGKNVWGERIFQVALILIGVFIAKGTDVVGEKRYIDSDVRAHLLDLTILGNQMEFTVALINAGNRQGLVTNIGIQAPVPAIANTALMSVPGAEVTSGEVPLVLEPGDVKLIRIQSHVPKIDDAVRRFESLSPPQNGGVSPGSQQGTLVYAVIRAIDFRGTRFEAKWKVCAIQYVSAGSVGWSPGDEQISVFAPQHEVKDGNWLSTDSMKRLAERTKQEAPSPESAK